MKQIKQYTRIYAFTLSIITYWGTPYRLLYSLSRSKEILYNYFIYTNFDISAVAKKRNILNHHLVQKKYV